MTLLRHLIWNDVRRFRWVLLLWVILVATVATLNGVHPILASDPRTLNLVGIASSLLWFAELLVMIALPPLVIQSDVVLGSNAFWMTRPIPPWLLLAAKTLLLIALFVLLPVVAEAIVMIWYHVPADAILRVAAERILGQTVLLTLLMAAAALTANMSRFVVLCVGVLVGLAAALTLMVTIGSAFARNALTTARPYAASAGEAGYSIASDPTGEIVMALLATCAAMALVMVQYRTRSRWRSVAAGVGGLLVVLGTPFVWSPRGLAPPLELPPGAELIRLVAEPDSVEANREGAGYFLDQLAIRQAKAAVRLDGLPPEWSANINLLGAALQLPDNRRILSFTGYATAVSMVGMDENPARVASRHVLNVDGLSDSTPVEGALPVILSLQDADYVRLVGTAVKYEGRFQVQLTRHDVDGTLPLRVGATHQRGAYRVVIDAVTRHADGTYVRVRASNALSGFDRTARRNCAYYLRNASRREALLGSTEWLGEESVFRAILPFYGYSMSGEATSGFSVRAVRVRFPEWTYANAPAPRVLDDGWMADAEMVIVCTTTAAAVNRTLMMERLSIPPATATTSR